jgi:hypothetical protein
MSIDRDVLAAAAVVAALESLGVPPSAVDCVRTCDDGGQVRFTHVDGENVLDARVVELEDGRPQVVSLHADAKLVSDALEAHHPRVVRCAAPALIRRSLKSKERTQQVWAAGAAAQGPVWRPAPYALAAIEASNLRYALGATLSSCINGYVRGAQAFAVAQELRDEHGRDSVEDHSYTNSKYACFASASAILAFDFALAARVATRSWDPPGAAHITTKSEVLTPADAALAQAVQFLILERHLDSAKCILNKLRTNYPLLQAQGKCLLNLARSDAGGFAAAFHTAKEAFVTRACLDLKHAHNWSFDIIGTAIGLLAMRAHGADIAGADTDRTRPVEFFTGHA